MDSYDHLNTIAKYSSIPLFERANFTLGMTQKSDVVLVAEPAVAGSGALKTARKGTGFFDIKIWGGLPMLVIIMKKALTLLKN